MTVDFHYHVHSCKFYCMFHCAVNPSIITHPMSQLTQDGSSITFTCLAVGFPSPSYNWSTPSTATDLMTSSIVFTASYNSYGDYTCAAGSNGVVVISDTAVLTGMYL